MAIEPVYNRVGLYDDILPHYEFAGMTDENLLRHVLTPLVVNRGVTQALELGCGTGRMTSVLREFVATPTCVDHSAAMLAAFHTRHQDLTAVHADARRYVAEAGQQQPSQWQLIVACWSLNYPLLECFETNTGKAIVSRDLDEGKHDAAAFLTALTRLLAPGGHLLTFFFDSDSAEQRFVTDLWDPVAPFPGTGRDFTRRLLLNHLAASDGTTETRHYPGHMHSPDLNRAEQWFLDGHFKSFPELSGDHEIRATIRRFLANHVHNDGTVHVPAGVYVITFTRA